MYDAYAYVYACHRVMWEVGEQFCSISLLPPFWRFQGWDSGHRSLQQVLLLTESLCWPSFCPVSRSCLLESVLYSTVLKCNPMALPLKSILPVGAQPRTALDCSKVYTFDSDLASLSSRVSKSSSSETTHLTLAEFPSPLFCPSILAQEMTILIIQGTY